MRLACSTLIGRAKEAAVIDSGVEAAVRGRGGVIFVAGEAGIGKTRLAAEAERLATDRGMRVLRGRTTPSSPQFRPLTEALFSVLRHIDPAADHRLDPFRPALSRLVPEWRVERPAGADDSLLVLAEAVLRLLGRLAAENGCVVILEDLHDADEDTLAVVEYLADNLANSPVLLIATVRTGHGAAIDLAHAAAGRRAATVLELARLGDELVRELVAGCLDTAPVDVPARTMERMIADADGIPFHIEELLAGMVDGGSLVRDGRRWRANPAPAVSVPPTVRASVAARVERLGPDVGALLRAGAVLGRRFPTQIAGRAAGLDDGNLLAALRSAVDGQLITPDHEQDGYAFRHALTADALQSELLPGERAHLARRAAEAIEECFADLPASWCPLAAALWRTAGNSSRAAELYCAAGRRALAQGAVATATALLEDGLALLDDGARGTAADLTEALLDALVVAGEIERAVELGSRFHRQASRERTAAVHVRLARAAAAAGRWSDGLREIERARDLLGPDAPPAQTAPVDAVAAQLAFGQPTPGRVSAARELATRALADAESVPLPEVACEALEVLGNCARLDDMAAADDLHERALALAERTGLTVWRIRMLYQLGAHEGVRTADATRLLRAREVALAAGAIVTALEIDCELAVVHISRGEYAEAQQRAERSEEAARKLRLGELRLIALGLRICAAGHAGDRVGVKELGARYEELGGLDIDFAAAVSGFGLAICSLLHEDRDRAVQQLAWAVQLEQDQLTHYLSFTHGPYLLLRALAGDVTWAQYEVVAGTSNGQATWNRQFVLLARAVLTGRASRAEEAEAAVAEFHRVSAPYPLGRHLGLRLVAQAALADGWGEPVTWLRAAEEYFHASSAAAVASACRTLLRSAGVRVPRRGRGGIDIPVALRGLGVTAREFEVLVLLAERLGNREISERLFLSPRTVEKHVASLLAKAGVQDRIELIRRCERMTGGTAGRANLPMIAH